MTKESWIIVYISLQLIICQAYWMKAEKRAAYLQGREDLYASMASAASDDPPYKK